MEFPSIEPLLDQLSDDLTDLHDALHPILSQSVFATGSKLPLLDRAKLFVLVTYAIESMLFSHVRLQGQNPKEHAVYGELMRVRQYFEKIKAAEGSQSQERKVQLNKEAAERFLRSVLPSLGQKSEGNSSSQALVESATTQATAPASSATPAASTPASGNTSRHYQARQNIVRPLPSERYGKRSMKTEEERNKASTLKTPGKR